MTCADVISQHSKYFTLSTSCVLGLFGLALIIRGIFIIIEPEEYYGKGSGIQFIVFVLWVGHGLLVISIAALGAYAAIRNNIFLINAYASILMLLFLLQLIIAVTVIILKQVMHNLAQNGLKDSFKSPDFHEFEQTAQCCGFSGYKDYEEMVEYVTEGYPMSCCQQQKERCLKPYEVGCSQRLSGFVYARLTANIAVYMCSAIFEFAASIFVCIINKEYVDRRTVILTTT